MSNSADIISWGQRIVDAISGWPGWLLVAAAALAIGYALRNWKTFPNQLIPGFIMFFTSAVYPVLQGGEPGEPGWIKWTMKNALIGLLIGFIAWRVHNQGLKRLEKRYPWLKFLIPERNTTFLANPLSGKIEPKVKL